MPSNKWYRYSWVDSERFFDTLCDRKGYQIESSKELLRNSFRKYIRMAGIE